jgi:hypothetical protein
MRRRRARRLRLDDYVLPAAPPVTNESSDPAADALWERLEVALAHRGIEVRDLLIAISVDDTVRATLGDPDTLPKPPRTRWTRYLDDIELALWDREERADLDNQELRDATGERVGFQLARLAVGDDLPTIRILLERNVAESLRERPRPGLFALIDRLRAPLVEEPPIA